MKRILEIDEVLGTLEMPDGTFEVCASGEALHDEMAERLEVLLSAFVRSADIRRKEQRFSPDWLPKPQTVFEGVGKDEAGPAARDVFHKWARRVREAAALAAHVCAPG